MHSFLRSGKVFHHSTVNEPNSTITTASAFFPEANPRAQSRPCLADLLLKGSTELLWSDYKISISELMAEEKISEIVTILIGHEISLGTFPSVLLVCCTGYDYAGGYVAEKQTVTSERLEIWKMTSKGTFEQDWNRTALEEIDILLLHKDSIEQKCWCPKLHTTFKVRQPQCRAERDNPLCRPIDDALPDALLDTVGSPGCQGTADS
ncbi:hypothetical protein WISP_63131 [Willisornis vidua]|uniref:Uncharacterized protein n=1 Tax=Willisornis vidua TaxID=1566151 RepID=A0ABQ9DF21_9PASS|nr:hypothetical protein WISP_63131 [Willisornis vidua]